MAIKVLMVAEKPSLARSLAEILSRKKCRRRKSWCSACDVYEFEGVFLAEGQSAAFKMTSVCGHVMSIDFLPKYNKWDQVDPVSTEMFWYTRKFNKRIARSFHCSETGYGYADAIMWYIKCCSDTVS